MGGLGQAAGHEGDHGPQDHGFMADGQAHLVADGGVVTLGDSTVRTRLLIGADGRRSTVARACAAPYADVRPGRSCAWYAYWDHSPLTEARAELRHGIFAGAFPTHSAQVLAFVKLSGMPGSGTFSTLTIASYTLTRPSTSSVAGTTTLTRPCTSTRRS